MLVVHNTLTGAKETFRPLEPGKVRMYACGITVYDYLHVGHARSLVVFDTLARYLRWSGYDVTFVRNITDIDDKIIQRAAKNREPIDALTERFIRYMREDCEAIGVLPADHEPRATEHLPAIVAMIERLVQRGHAYVGGNGDVYYRVGSFADYGKLSGRRLADLRVGARVEVDEAKDDPLDFVLWKATKPGQPSWPSPWGPGRPGWHIECSAMSVEILGGHFDLHGGGQDLIFPHHENEIAQTCGATGEPFVNYWLHNGFVRIDEEKMSKSLGNFFTIRTVLETYPAEALRYFVLSSHYRSPLNYSDANLDQARTSLARLYTALRGVAPAARADAGAMERFRAVMDDDLNTAEALALLQELAGELNRARAAQDDARTGVLAATLTAIGGVLGLLQADADAWLKSGGMPRGLPAGTEQEAAALADAAIEARISERNLARARKDFAEADRIRDDLAAQGVVLEDGPSGTTWRRA